MPHIFEFLKLFEENCLFFGFSLTVFNDCVNITSVIHHMFMKYASLNLGKKRSLIKEVDRRNTKHEPVTCRIMASWWQHRFGMFTAPGKSTVAVVLSDAQNLSFQSVALVIPRCFGQDMKHIRS